MIDRAAIWVCGLALLAVFALTGCTIRDTYQNGTRERTITFGIAEMPDPAKGAYSARMRGIGISATIMGGAIGYFDHTVQMPGPDCHGHYVFRDARHAALFAEMFPSREICATVGVH